MIGTSSVQWTPPEGTPPGQGCAEILPAVGTPVVDVPVIMQLAFLQSVLVPQVQFLDRMLDIPVMLQSQVQNSSTTAVACIVMFLLVLMHLALCSRRLLTHGMEKYAQSMLRPPSCFLGNLDNISMSPLYLADIFSSLDVAPVDFLGALDDEEFFVVEGSGSGSQ